MEIVSLSIGDLPSFLVLWGLTIQPDRHKRHESTHHAPEPGNPDPTSGNPPTPWPLVMRKMSYSHLAFLLDVRQERALEVYLESEDAVLVR
jgi:hypothetical protein